MSGHARRTVSLTALACVDPLADVRVGDDPGCRRGDERRGQSGEDRAHEDGAELRGVVAGAEDR